VVDRNSALKKGLEDGELVYENKVVWFMDERVLNREIRQSRYKKHRTTTDGATIKQTVGLSTVEGYVSAIADWWSSREARA
jgi:hypothetical protein